MSDYYTREFDTLSSPPRKDHLFLWTVFILLLTGFAMACWLGSFYIFGHPENARSYKILLKLHKLDPPKRFELTAAPPGEFLTAQKLFERYNTYPPLKLQAENDELLRMYINNYQSTKKLVPYIIGRFTIVSARPLTPADIFPSGVVAVAQSADYPQVLLEHVYTAAAADVPALQAMLKTGLDVKLARTLDLAAVVHIQRLENGSLQFTAVPLLYGSYAVKQGEGTFSLQPPPALNLVAGLPILRGPPLAQALQDFAQYQRANTPVSSALDQPMATPASSAPPSPELVRVNSSPNEEISLPMHGPKVKGRASAKPSVAIAAASPQPRARATPAPETLAMENAPARAMETPAEAAAETRVEPAIPVETPPPARSANGVPLTPFLQSAPEPVLTNNGASWRTYAPGQMPRGRVIQPAQAAPLAESGMGGERLYLRGNFVVTASEENRAVLRPQGTGIAAFLKPSAGATRVIVQYPAGVQPPVEGSTFSRDDARPFLITDVRRGADGQINLYVREITTQQ
ncbi:MAG TPA: hypothetical protein VHY22_16520 [Chthoniobacteraceae bacterium]|jgi:hypothetical protein|nr:hypothetical protein [Chthoniobacteraceae bacterium]